MKLEVIHSAIYFYKVAIVYGSISPIHFNPSDTPYSVFSASHSHYWYMSSGCSHLFIYLLFFI